MFKLTALLPKLRATLADLAKEKRVIQTLLRTGWQETIASSDYPSSHIRTLNVSTLTPTARDALFILLRNSVNTSEYFMSANLKARYDNGIITITSNKNYEVNGAEKFIGELIDAVKQTDSGTTRQPLLSGKMSFSNSAGLRAALPEHVLPTVIGTLQTIGNKVEFDSNGLTPEERKNVLRGTGAYKIVGTKVEIRFSDESDACSTEAEIRDRLEDLLDTNKAKEKGSKNLIRPGYT